MKKQLALLAITGILLFSSCLTSLHPLYTAETEIYDASLLGLWKEGDESLFFEKASKGNYYKLTFQDTDDPPEEIEAHLLKLGEHYYLDFQRWRENGEYYDYHFFAPSIDAHNFARVTWNKSEIRLNTFDVEKIEELLKHRRARISHERLEGDQFILTAKPQELQQFVLKYADELLDFSDPMVLPKKEL